MKTALAKLNQQNSKVVVQGNKTQKATQLVLKKLQKAQGLVVPGHLESGKAGPNIGGWAVSMSEVLKLKKY